MANKTGVYPVFENKFKIGARGAAAKNTIADMETFTVAIDGNVEEWKPMEAEGWVRRMVTGKSLKITLSGKRNIGDAAAAEAEFARQRLDALRQCVEVGRRFAVHRGSIESRHAPVPVP